MPAGGKFDRRKEISALNEGRTEQQKGKPVKYRKKKTRTKRKKTTTGVTISVNITGGLKGGVRTSLNHVVSGERSKSKRKGSRGWAGGDAPQKSQRLGLTNTINLWASPHKGRERGEYKGKALRGGRSDR